MSALAVATEWSQLPLLMKAYFSRIDANDGVMRVFGYASLIDRHDALKPQISRRLPNERGRMLGMEVGMNLKTEKLFAGLEPSAEGHAEGIIITIRPEDRYEALAAYIKRELGEPPWGAGIGDIYTGVTSTFARVKGTEKDKLPKYTLQIADIEIPTFTGIKSVPALAVVTNAALATSLVGETPKHIAQLLHEDAQSLNYFHKDVLAPARACGMRQRKIEEIEAALRS